MLYWQEICANTPTTAHKEETGKILNNLVHLTNYRGKDEKAQAADHPGHFTVLSDSSHHIMMVANICEPEIDSINRAFSRIEQADWIRQKT
ncbi:unnamed protein product [Parascedosporium putredinis]|uniref:Uncharacterized protein n=1 Tax=Parascedosporium putredinis TaxID=1442378 RepID=A0A9P1MBW0_9PEZI|nr:unnamed protein product [Parascedosporium putredinis]CAI7996533.1 unnamed protein product [Parascedosporium putredinis]